VNPRATLATARRVLTQLRHDPRSVAILVLVPTVLMVLLRYMLDDAVAFDAVAPALLGVFPLTLMFIITSVTMQRERASGTLERLMTTPLGRADLLFGYALAFALFALLQVAVVVSVSVLLGLDIRGSLWPLVLVTIVDALLGTALGLLASAFARTEFQAIQLMPVILFPQMLLCGLFVPREHMSDVLRWASNVLPMSYAVEAIQQAARHSVLTGRYVVATAVVAGCALAALGLAALSLRRRTG
jgi:ABC-2 type transport system permease protein